MRVTPSGNSKHISIGDVKDIVFDGDCIETSKTRGMHNNFFGKNELKGMFCKTREGYNLSVEMKNEKRNFEIKKGLTASDKKIIEELKPKLEKAKERYNKYSDKVIQMIRDRKTDTEEYKRLKEKEDEARIKYHTYYDRIRDIRDFEKDYFYDIDEEELSELFKYSDVVDIQLSPLGRIQGTLFDFSLDLPTGPPPAPRSNKSNIMNLEPAPYSAIQKIDESAWENEFKTKPDAIDFFLQGTHTATTLSELKNMRVKKVRIHFPSGKIKEYDLDTFLGD